MALSLYCFVLLLTLCLDAMTSGNFRISSPLPMKELEPRFGRSILSWLGSFLFRVPYTKTYIFFSLLPRLDKVLILFLIYQWPMYIRVIRTPVDNLLGYIYDRCMYIASMYINGFWFEKPSETMGGFKRNSGKRKKM